MSDDFERFSLMVDRHAATRLQYEFRPDDGGPPVVYETPNRRVLLRVYDLGQAEPETLAWMNELTPDDVLYDIGANIGLFTIWAARVRGARVAAFEPESQNYALICRNIMANGVQDLATAYCLGVGDRTGLDTLHLPEFSCGRSGNQLGQAVDVDLHPRAMAFRQGCMGMRLDDIVATAGMPAPTRLKVDVDGIEHKIVAGAAATLASPTLRSIIIETNTCLDEHARMLETIAAAGFRLEPPGHTDGRHVNHIFRR